MHYHTTREKEFGPGNGTENERENGCSVTQREPGSSKGNATVNVNANVRGKGSESAIESERENGDGMSAMTSMVSIHPAKVGCPTDGHRSVCPRADASSSALIDDVRHQEIRATTSSTTDHDGIKGLQDELAAAKMALAQTKEELEAEKRFSANEKQVAATYAQKYLLLRERSQLTKDTLVKVQTDLKSERRKNEELEQVISDLQREMTGPKMAPEVLDALVKIAGMTLRVKDALDREGAMT